MLASVSLLANMYNILGKKHCCILKFFSDQALSGVEIALNVLVTHWCAI